MFSNRVEITFSSILGPLTLYDDPINYDQSEFDIKRSEATHGIFLKQTNNLEFTGKAKQYLENLYTLKGVHAKCNLTRKEKHPTTDDWYLKPTGFLNFFSKKIKENKLLIDFVEGGLREVLVSQMREKFELDRKTDINSQPIPVLKRDVLSNKGREIYLLSKFRQRSDSFTHTSGRWDSVNEDRPSFHPFPLEVIANSDPLNIQPPFETYKEEERWNSETFLNFFYATGDRDKGKIRFGGKVSFTLTEKDFNRVNEYNVKVVLTKFTTDDNGDNLTEVLPRMVIQDLGNPQVGDTFNIEIPEMELEVKKNENYGIGLYAIGQYGSGLPPGPYDGWMNNTYSNFKGGFYWAEDSFFQRTNNPCLPAKEAGKRLSVILTGKECFESRLLDGTDNTYLKDQDHELVFAPGGWLRNLKKKDENEVEKEWPMEISFEDFYKSIHAILPVGYGISIQGNEQKIVFEDLRYFFQRTVVGSLGKIQIKERSTAEEYCYQSLKFGYTKGGDYEQPLGLDEYNTQTNSRTPLTGTDNEYEAIGPSRTDSYGAEDARRKQYEDTADEDTPYDKDNFLFDVKLITRSNQANYYEPRTWQDDFEVAPTGVYSPDTAFNLNLSPGRNRLRHSYFWINSIIMLQDENIQFVNNTKGNSNLTTKKAGERALKENEENIPINVFDNPIFKPEWIDAEAAFDQNILDNILGSTLIDGRSVNNYYGLWEFINERNQPEYGFIFSVKSKDKFTYKLLKASGI